ncbi:MAG: anti-sigma factor [Actinomycetota bacterium]|nr:anti-sigma factor [Actinomycetota bacterium]
MDRPHEEYKGLIAAYVLGAIPPDELAEVSGHIVSCDTCTEEVNAQAKVVGKLALTVDPVPLPDGFADGVVALARQRSPISAGASEPTGGSPVSAGASEPTGGQVLPFRRPVLSGVLAAAAAVIIGVLGAGFLDARSDLQRSRQVISALTADRGLALAGTRGAKGHMVPTENGAVFAVAGLPEPPAGRTYQLWAIRNDKPLSLGTFGVEEGQAVVRIEDPVDEVDAMAVTVEPEGGSAQPSTDPVMRSA